LKRLPALEQSLEEHHKWMKCDEGEPTRTELDLPDIYELSQLHADPMTPKLLERRLRRME